MKPPTLPRPDPTALAALRRCMCAVFTRGDAPTRKALLKAFITEIKVEDRATPGVKVVRPRPRRQLGRPENELAACGRSTLTSDRAGWSPPDTGWAFRPPRSGTGRARALPRPPAGQVTVWTGGEAAGY